VPLATGTTYTINVTGVLDITGNAQSSFPSQSFTTGTGIDLVTPTVVSTYPTSGQTLVPVNATLQAVFSQPNSSLIGAGLTYYFEISYQAQLWDVGGNVLNYGYIQFTTQ